MSFKLFYYIKRFSYNKLPRAFFKAKYARLKAYEQQCDSSVLNQRLDYYVRLKGAFEIPAEAILIKDFRKTRGTDYFLDLKEFLHYFNPNTQLAYRFGDDTHQNAYPTLMKAREISQSNTTSVLFKLNKRRHFQWVEDGLSFAEKRDMLVWRGGAYKTLRRSFVEKFWNHPLCNVGQTNKPVEDVPWQKDFLSIEEQLGYKFIFCPEGNDVATNLKWVMSSNSLAIMPKPRYETWFMEGTLKSGVHYVEVKSDFSDLSEKMEYYQTHPEEAEKIIRNAHQYVKQFQDPNLEDLLCLKVLERYTQLSQQEDALLF